MLGGNKNDEIVSDNEGAETNAFDDDTVVSVFGFGGGLDIDDPLDELTRTNGGGGGGVPL